MSKGVVLFFDTNSAFQGVAAQQDLYAALVHLVQTIRGIRKQNRKAHLYATEHPNRWFIDAQQNLNATLGKEEMRLLKNMILKNPVARFFEFLGPERIQHQGQDSVAFTAAVRFKSAVLSFHQGSWAHAQLQGMQYDGNITIENFSALHHVLENTEVLKRQNLPVDLLSYDKEEHDPPFNNHGQKVYSNGHDFITADIDEHNTSKGWKKFDRRGNRLGTYNTNLERIGD